MKPLQLSTETALKLSKELKIPLEQLMHLPQHILIQKLMEVEKKERK
ncbi:YycC family protein [Bacillus sp. ISL-18]|nr:YycC family protein [Bacillus sp. ISL-18]MBT2656520.1 YycC family protein [Bacillus sp. ISL-18]